MRVSRAVFLWSFTTATFLALAPSRNARAEDLDGYIGPWAGLSIPVHASPSGLRAGGRFEFGRYSKNIALDVRAETGAGFSDYGGELKVFGNYPMVSNNSRTGIGGGLGIGAVYSSGFSASALSGLPNTTANVSFWQLIVNPFVRGVYETNWGFAVVGELGLQMIPSRYASVGLAGSGPNASSAAQFMLDFMVGIQFDF